MDRFGLSLYDDLDSKQKSDQVAGWSSGIKLLQSQMQLKKATQTQVKRDATRKLNSYNPSVANNDSKIKKDEEPNSSPANMNLPIFPTLPSVTPAQKPNVLVAKTNSKNAVVEEPHLWDVEWNFDDEYSPFWPNDYEMAVIDLRERRDREKELEDVERQKRKDDRLKREKDKDDRLRNGKGSENEEDERSNRSGVTIAPPSMLQDASTIDITPKPAGGSHGSSVAAKIMAKYGFKEGQGLGKKEQGMSVALQVEKTSKRGGRIIHEKELNPVINFELPSAQSRVHSPPTPPYETAVSKQSQQPQQEQQQLQDVSITEIMREPSKVVLLRNMVGPGEVDQDLEPEVKDECNTKYGDVIKVLIHELPNGPQDEAVRIFVEFKRMESAIKAVIDLNGRFFGGRQVKAGFYNLNRFLSFQLLD